MSKAASALSLIQAHFASDTPEILGVAVSGGSDSTALLVLLHDWANAGGPALRVVTVDHGLRVEAAEEAAEVARFCAGLGIPHEVLQWRWDGTGNLSDQARRGRYMLMAEWAQALGLHDVAVGHTQDDVAETFLMRLSRGAGLDGLSAMATRREVEGVVFHRPLLGASRTALRAVLTARGIGWAEDPTNEDEAYLRANARKVLADLEPLGVTAETLAEVSGRLADARSALGFYAVQAAGEVVRFDAGDVVIDRAGLLALPGEIVRRLLQAALLWVSGEEYPARGVALTRLIEAVQSGEDGTLQGCRVLVKDKDIRVTREAAAVADLCAAPGEAWDGRWVLSHPEPAPDVTIAALTEAGLGACPGRKATGRPAASLISGPAVWLGDTLVAAPLAGKGQGWTATLCRSEDLFSALLMGTHHGG